MTNILVNTEQAAEMLSVSEPYIRKLIGRGELPSVKLGRKCTRILTFDLLAYVDSKARAAEGVAG